MDGPSKMLGCLKTVNYVYLVVLSGNFLALTGDASIAWPSPVLIKLDSDDTPLDRRPTKDELSWVASMSGFGSFASVLPFSLLPDIIGRKPSLLLIAIPHIISFTVAAFAKTIEMIYLARFMSGFSISGCYIVLPMYVAEISENSNRGLMLVSFAIFSNFGACLTYITGPYMSMFWFNMFLVIFPICFFVSFFFLAPESPHFYVMKNRKESARKSLEKLRRNDLSEIDDELSNILKESESARRNISNILGTLTKKYAIKGTLIAVMLTSFQQLSGYAVFVPYTQQIFEEIGSKLDSAVSSIIVGSVAFFASFICPFIIDKKGRRFVLITSTIGIIFFEVLFGFYYFLREGEYDLDSVKWLPVVCLMGYMLFYTFGLGPLPLTVTSEVLPVNIKFLVSTFAGLTGTVCSTIMQKKYYDLNDSLGYYGTIWLFAFLCSILLIFIIFYLPETKGKRFSEILEKLQSFSFVLVKAREFVKSLFLVSGNFLALTGDSSTSWSSPIIPKLSSNDTSENPLGRPITPNEMSWIGSLNSMGAMVGLYPFGLMSDIFGRKFTLLTLAIPHFTAFIIYALSKDIRLFYLGRFFNGLSVGAGYVVLPMYIAEISNDSNRGLMLVSYTVFSSFGNLLSFAAGPYLSIFWFNIFLSVFPAIFFVSFYIIAPESPYHHVNKNEFKKAKQSIEMIRPYLDEDQVDKEIQLCKSYLDMAQKKDILKTLRTKVALKGTLIAIILSTLQQFTGQAAFMAYNETIFEDAGINIEAHVASIIVGTVFFFSSFVGVSLVDRTGRKFLLYCSSSGLILSELLLGLYYVCKEDGGDDLTASFSILPVFCLMLFMFMFNIGVGPLPLTITSEILPMNIKFLVATTAGFSSWMASFLVTKFFHNINDCLNNSGTVFLFMGFCVSFLIFTYFFVPETKGKSLHSIQMQLKK